jgi:hypothetical protein
MRGFLTWLAGSERGGAALVEPGVRDRAVRDYKRHVQTARHWAPSTVNQVGVPAPAGQRLAAQPGRILGHHVVRVDGLAPASGRLLGPGSHGPPVSRSTVRPPRPDRWSH